MPRISNWPWLPLALLGLCWFFNVTITFAHVAATNLASKAIVINATLDAGLATLPLGLMLSSNAAATLAAGFLFHYVGYKRVFIGGAVLGILGGLVCFAAMLLNGTLALGVICLGVVPSGISMGIVNYYRHVATLLSTRGEAGAAKNVAIVFTSGAVGGVVGPALATGLKDVVPGFHFAGVYIAAAIISVFHLVTLLFLDTSAAEKPTIQDSDPRPLWHIVRQREYVFCLVNATVCMCVMMLIMTVTPLVLDDEYGTPFWFSSVAIQVHVVCMYAPSFLTSFLISRFQARNLIAPGLLLSAIGASLYAPTPPTRGEETQWLHAALVAVGVSLVGFGWNWSFVSATSMLAKTYRPQEKFKAQTLNDTTVITFNAIATLVSGTLLDRLGRLMIIVGALAAYGCVFVMDVAYLLWEYWRRTKSFAPHKLQEEGETPAAIGAELPRSGIPGEASVMPTLK